METQTPPEIDAKFQAKEEWLKREQFPSIGASEGICRNPGGGWQCNYGKWCTVTIRPGDDEPRETHGGICGRWHREGGAFDDPKKPGWLGYPVSDEEVYEDDGDSADRISHFENGDIVWTAKTDTTRILNIKDRAKWYRCKHDQLLELLREAVEAPAPERHNEALRAVDEKCREDQFDIVLLGDFQHGKSTTLDTLCGGREMSPQGSGRTPTSAVPVSIQSLSREEDGEYAEIHFKTNRELVGELFDTFESDLCKPDSGNPLLPFIAEGDGTRRERFCEGFDFDKSAHRAAARQALEEAWHRYGESDESRFRFPARQRQLMEVATLVVRFHGSRDHHEMLAAARCPVDEIGGYVWFPSDWSDTLTKAFDYDIAFEDARFAFVDAVILHVRSPFLEKLGCRVTDCPGLDASAYDKEVTRKALFRADGVLFVQRCTRMIGASALGTLFEFVQDTGRTDKTVLALNLWGIGRDVALHDAIDRRGRKAASVVNASIQQIRGEGHGFPVVWCHVLLAYLSALGERRRRTDEAFTQMERGWLAEKAGILDENGNMSDDGRPDDALWVAAVGGTNRMFRVRELDGVSALDESAIAAVWKASNFDELLGAAAETVLREKADSILVANGSRTALETLRNHERELQLKEEEAERDEKACAEEVEAAKRDLDEYQREAEKLVRQSYFARAAQESIDGLSRALLEEILSEDFFCKVSKKISKVVYDLNKNRTGVSQADFKQRFAAETAPLVIGAYADCAIAVLNRWQSRPSGRWKRYLEDISDLNENLHELGKRHFGGKRLFQNVPIPDIPDAIQKNALSEQLEAPLAEHLNAVVEELREGFWKGLLDAFIWLLTLGGRVLDALGLSKTEDEIVRENMEKIRPSLEASFNDYSIRNTLERGINPVFEKFHDAILHAIEDARAAYRSKIQARCDELIELHRTSTENKRACAEANRKLREECIAPLRGRIEEFEKSVQTTELSKG